MSYLNVSLTPSYVVTLEYNKVDENFVFKSDINCINGWKIKNIIKIDSTKDPCLISNNHYYNFLEFVIKDNNGHLRVKRYFYNNYESQNVKENTGVHCKHDLSPSQAIAYFIENTKIFHYANWEEYDAGDLLEQISDIMNEEISKEDMLHKIRTLLVK